MEQNVTFDVSRISEEIGQKQKKLLALLENNGQKGIGDDLVRKLQQLPDDKTLRIAFIGEYSSGKSSIISALTGDRSIKIDSDITTSTATDYDWMPGVVLTDTPGLNEEYPEHNARAIEAINRSDILLYCITSDLFNETTLKDFKKWAYDKQYLKKMYFVINKMSKEDGEYQELVDNYTLTIERSLGHSLRELPHSFIDARDYRTGVDNNWPEYIKESHFEPFIESLNRFVKKDEKLAKLSTPIHVLVDSIDNVLGSVVADPETDAYIKTLKHVENEVTHIRDQANKELRAEVKHGLREITRKGDELACEITADRGPAFTEEDFEQLCSDVCNNIDTTLEPLERDYMSLLQKRVQDILHNETAEFFFRSAEKNASSGFLSSIFHSDAQDRKKRLEHFRDFANQLGKGAKNGSNYIAENAVKAGVEGLKGGSGTAVHKAVLDIGHRLGHKFKPWEALKLTEKFGKAASFVGKAAPIVGAAIDVAVLIKSDADEEAAIEELKAAQIEYTQGFYEARDELEVNYEKDIEAYLADFTQNIDEISRMRTEALEKISKQNAFVRDLQTMRNELLALESSIYQ